MNQYCDGKQIYTSKKFAKAIRNGRERHGARELRIYECPKCYGYHLTASREGFKSSSKYRHNGKSID